MDIAHPVKWRLVPVSLDKAVESQYHLRQRGTAGACAPALRCPPLSLIYARPPACRTGRVPTGNAGSPALLCSSFPQQTPQDRPVSDSRGPGRWAPAPTAPAPQAGSQECLFPGVALPEPGRPLTGAAPAAWRPGHLCPLLLPPGCLVLACSVFPAT